MIFTGWRKSEHSNPNGECVEVANWRTSHQCGADGSCVEVGTTPARGVAVRDTQNRDGATLTFSASTWERFITTL